jgi:hypothetical protein
LPWSAHQPLDGHGVRRCSADRWVSQNWGGQSKILKRNVVPLSGRGREIEGRLSDPELQAPPCADAASEQDRGHCACFSGNPRAPEPDLPRRKQQVIDLV